MNQLTKYKEIESFLFRQLPMFQRIGDKAFKKDLKNIKYLDEYLGNPHKNFKSIHIAGTNGKGSTSFFIASALHQAGYKVGLYTSPHYKDYRERIKVDGQMVSKSFVKSFVNRLIADNIFQSEIKPSFFEISVAMAFEYFKISKVDIAIIETGLGGRLDSTNIITPELSVITNIGFDHTNFLGNTIPKIAKEKAGIIKKGKPVIIGRKQSLTHSVFKAIASKRKTRLSYAKKHKLPEQLQRLINKFPNYQKENFQSAFAAIKLFDDSISVSTILSSWKSGLKKWGYIGRYSFIQKNPRVLADSAHNKDGIKVLMDEVNKEKFSNLHIVLAVVNDKDLNSVLPLFPKSARYYFSQAKIPRALPKEELKKKAEEFQLIGKSYVSVKTALSIAKRQAKKTDLILVAGSIFTVAEVV